nr:hypothetical protein [Tanacetum cinerariifolium]
MMIYLKNTAGYKLDFLKGMSYDEIRPIFQARFDANMMFLLKSRKEMEEEDQEVLKSINETPAQKAAKRRKLNEEAQELILLVERRYLLLKFTLEQLVNVTRLQVEEESEMSLELLRIPTTVLATTPTTNPPVIHNKNSLIPAETPTILLFTSMIPPTAPTTHYISPLIYTDLSDDDTSDTPPSPTHKIPPVEVAPPNQIPPASIGRVGTLPTHCLAVRHSVDYSSSDHFTFDDSSRDLPSYSSSETLSDSSSDALSDSSSGHSSLSHSSPALPSGVVMSLTQSLISTLRFLADIDVCIAYTDALRAEGIYVRVVVETVAREEVEMSAKGTIEVRDDRVMHLVVSDNILDPAQEEGAIKDTYETLGDLRISKLEKDNTRLRGMLDVTSQRVTRFQTMPNTRSTATMTCEVVNKLIDRRVAEALETRDAATNLEPLLEGGGELEDVNGGVNRNGGVNGNGNDNGNEGVNGNGNRVGNGNGNCNGNGGGNVLAVVSLEKLNKNVIGLRII